MNPHKNLAYATVGTAPTPAASGTTLALTSGHGARMPAVPFEAAVWPAGAQPDPSNAEIVKVTDLATDAATIVRAQGGTSARTIVAGDQFAAAITEKDLREPSAASAPSEDVYVRPGHALPFLQGG